MHGAAVICQHRQEIDELSDLLFRIALGHVQAAGIIGNLAERTVQREVKDIALLPDDFTLTVILCDLPRALYTKGRLEIGLRRGKVTEHENIVQPLTASDHIVDQQIYAINACHGDDRLLLKFERQRFFLSRRYGTFLCGLQLSAQNLGYEIAVAARRFQKPAVYTIRLLFYQIQHSVDFTFSCKDLAVIGHTLSGFYLLCHKIPPDTIILLSVCRG